jgi:hypothetical protein
MTGFPLAMAGLTLVPFRALANAERTRIAEVLDEPELRSKPIWRDLLHAAVRWAPNTVSLTAVATWWAGALGGLTWALWGWALPADGAEVPELLGFGDDYTTIVGLYFALGLLFAVTLPAVARWAARFEARFARKLLTPREPA